MNNSNFRITEVDLRVTDRCVAHCAHCASSALKNGSDVLSLEVAERFLGAVSERWGAPSHWCISGGEPMLYAERVVELAKLGLTMGMAPRLSTNGYWAESPDRARSGVHRLRDEGFVHVWVSTDSFHEEFVPVERVHFLLRALRDEPMPFFVNLNYLFPTGTELGGLGIPQVRSELERDVRTLCIHREAARDVGNEQHGWCRVMDLGRGRRLLDSLGVAAEEARRVLQLYREIIERPNVLELSPSGDVIHRCRVLGNVDNGEFPGFLSQVS